VLRFFDEYLAGRPTGLRDEARVQYFTMHEEAWHAAPGWPPIAETRRCFLAAGNALADAPGAAGTDRYRVDFAAGTGTRTRHERLAAVATTEYYPDWPAHVAPLLSYDLPALAHDAEIAGHPVVTLWLAADQGDATLFVYLSEVEADGRARYITEGVLRALHRAEAPCPRFEQRAWPYHPFSRAAAAPLTKGKVERLRFALLPTAWRVKAGSRLRLSIAGADADHYVQLPHGRPPVLTIHHGGEQASMIELPWRAAPGIG
jgi:putative CocE/NonD family hydrolase